MYYYQKCNRGLVDIVFSLVIMSNLVLNGCKDKPAVSQINESIKTKINNGIPYTLKVNPKDSLNTKTSTTNFNSTTKTYDAIITHLDDNFNDESFAATVMRTGENIKDLIIKGYRLNYIYFIFSNGTVWGISPLDCIGTNEILSKECTMSDIKKLCKRLKFISIIDSTTDVSQNKSSPLEFSTINIRNETFYISIKTKVTNLSNESINWCQVTCICYDNNNQEITFSDEWVISPMLDNPLDPGHSKFHEFHIESNNRNKIDHVGYQISTLR